MSDNGGRYLSPQQVCDLIPGMTVGNLAQLRYKGGGPTFKKASTRVIVYAEDDVRAWVEAATFERNDRPVARRHLRTVGGAA